MAEEQQPEQDPGDLEKAGGAQAVILEIDAASADLGDFIRWCAKGAYEDESEELAESFDTVVSLVYSYCRAKNDQPIEGTTENEDTEGSSG